MPHLDTEISVKSTHKSSGKRHAANCSGMEFGLECGGGSEDHQRQEAGGVAIKMEQARARLLRGSTSAGTATRSPESRRRSSGTGRRKTKKGLPFRFDHLVRLIIVIFFFSERDFIFRGGKSETSRLVTALYHHSSPSSTSFDTFLTFLSFKSHSDTFLFVYFLSLPLQGSATGIWLGYDSISGPYKDILLLPNSVLCILRLMKVLSFSFRCAFYFF